MQCCGLPSATNSGFCFDRRDKSCCVPLLWLLCRTKTKTHLGNDTWKYLLLGGSRRSCCITCPAFCSCTVWTYTPPGWYASNNTPSAGVTVKPAPAAVSVVLLCSGCLPALLEAALPRQCLCAELLPLSPVACSARASFPEGTAYRGLRRNDRRWYMLLITLQQDQCSSISGSDGSGGSGAKSNSMSLLALACSWFAKFTREANGSVFAALLCVQSAESPQSAAHAQLPRLAAAQRTYFSSSSRCSGVMTADIAL